LDSSPVHVEWVAWFASAVVVAKNGLEDCACHVNQNIGSADSEIEGLGCSAEIDGCDSAVADNCDNTVAIGLVAPCLSTLGIEAVSDDSNASGTILGHSGCDSRIDLSCLIANKPLIGSLKCVGARLCRH
jgi:hypothetical protein